MIFLFVLGLIIPKVLVWEILHVHKMGLLCRKSSQFLHREGIHNYISPLSIHNITYLHLFSLVFVFKYLQHTKNETFYTRMYYTPFLLARIEAGSHFGLYFKKKLWKLIKWKVEYQHLKKKKKTLFLSWTSRILPAGDSYSIQLLSVYTMSYWV